jgi:hypothetical protein
MGGNMSTHERDAEGQKLGNKTVFEPKRCIDRAADNVNDTFRDRFRSQYDDALTSKECGDLIRSLAEEMKTSAAADIDAKANIAAEIAETQKKFKKDVLDWAKIVDESERDRKALLEMMRQYRMAITAEMGMIEKALKAVAALKPDKLATDIECVVRACQSPAIVAMLAGAKEVRNGQGQ